MELPTIVITLTTATTQIYRYVPIFLLFSGLIGNAMSCLVFVQNTLRSNPCTWYFLAATIANIIYLLTLLSPMLDAWNKVYNLINTIPILCKITMFIILITRTLSLWPIALASIDRYLASSTDPHRRQLRNRKPALFWLSMICLVFTLIWAESIYCFDANLLYTPIPCYTKSDACRLYNDITLSLITIITPSLLMLIFGLLTISNIRQSKRLAQPSSTEAVIPSGNSRKLERTLTKMLLLQVFLAIILNLPHALCILYLTITFDQVKTLVQHVTDGFIFNVLLLLPFVSSCISFYIYTLSGSVFRRTFKQSLKKAFGKLKPKHQA